MKRIKCDCGWAVESADEDELVTEAQRHASEVHHLPVTREQALSLAVPVEQRPSP
jgi:predicted small metal-binding protein